MAIIRAFTKRGVILSGLLGILFGAGAYTLVEARALSYLSDDPAACVNCHIMREAMNGWQNGSHHAVATCNDCHVPHDLVGKYLAKAEAGYRHSVAFTLQNFHEPIRVHESTRKILELNCISCHAEAVSQITAHAGAESQDCVRCHRSVGHGP